MKRYVAAVTLLMGIASWASAITVDGTRDAEYGAAIAVQKVDTQFGDANPVANNLGGSELDAAYARIEGGRLYILLTGNHEPNFNKLDIFIDSVAGGESVMSGTPQYDFMTHPGFWNSQQLGGLTFDAGFTADYHLFTRWGGGNTPGPYEADFVNRQGGASVMVPGSSEATGATGGLIKSGFIPAGDVGTNASGSALTQNLEFAINNSNADGVFGGTGQADEVAAAAVATGMEFSIALADIGNPSSSSQIRIAAMINNSNHNYLSNQFLGSLTPPQGNLGIDGTGQSLFGYGDFNENGSIDAADYVRWRQNAMSQADYDKWKAAFGADIPRVNLSSLAGNQFFTVTVPGVGAAAAVPEPGSMLLSVAAGLIAWGLVRRR
jgi:hypothetical protein